MKFRLCLLLTLLLAGPALAADLPVIAHRADISFNLETHLVEIVDVMGLPAGLEGLRLGAGLILETAAGPGGTADLGAVLRHLEDDDGPYQTLDLAALGLADGGDLTLVYSGTFFQSVEGAVFSREKVGGEITATISEEGIYLSAAAEWLAWNKAAMAVHDLTLDTPAGFETVTQGRRAEHEARAGRLHTRWVAEHPSDGLNLIAQRFVVHEEPVREGLVSQTFFLSDDARLRGTYMERTKAYIAMYEEMIGPYPYAKFATVENWFPTGYGMPSYTLLGGQVLRLPFIPYTSFGHEICHNWWGNSIFVDTDEGNWCEGLTSYCADYHYKALESEAAATEYRRNLLKDYAAYVRDPAQDFPLSEFVSRHSGATRAVGYGKSLMVFHMIQRLVGPEVFSAGLKAVAADHMFARTAWSDFLQVFSDLSGQDLEFIRDQWLTRTGALSLAVDDVVFDGDKVRFKLLQGAPPYDVQVPVTVTGAGGEETVLVHLDKMHDTYELEIAGARALSVDPDCHLFRYLHPAEIEPTLSQILAEELPVFVADGATPEMEAAGRGFARAFTELEEGFSFNNNGVLSTDHPAAGLPAHVVMNPGADLLKQYGVPGLTVAGNTVYLDGKRYALDKFDFVFAAPNPLQPSRSDLVILCGSPQRLESLARRVGHYGKYSWLMLPAGQGRVERGNWPTTGSPLVVTAP